MVRGKRYDLKKKLSICWETAQSLQEAHGRIISIGIIGRYIQEIHYSDGFTFHIDELSGCSGVSTTVRVYANGDYYIDIDNNADTSTAKFVVTKDNYATVLFQVNEAGELTLGPNISIDADGNITLPDGTQIAIGATTVLTLAAHTKAIHDALGIDADTLDGEHAAAFAPAAKGVTNGDSHDHAGGDGAQIDHGGLAGLADGDHDAKYLAKDNTEAFTPDADYEPATKKYVDDAGGSEDFVGVVKMYEGSGIADVATRTEELGYREGDTVPERPGWYVCNGQSGTPNLLNKFIRSESTSGNIGGSDVVANHEHSGYGDGGDLRAAIGACNDDVYTLGYIGVGPLAKGNPTYVVRGASVPAFNYWNHYTPVYGTTSANGGGTGTNKPAYYSLIFIIKMS